MFISCFFVSDLIKAQTELEIAFPNLSFVRPVDLQYPDDNTNRLFVVEQQGVIYVFENNEKADQKKIFLDIIEQVNDSGNEEGLLGLAFHPDYQNNGYFFVDYTASTCDTSGLTLPIWEYSHSEGQSITGGYVYRGDRVPELTGKYIYADYVSGRIWALDYDGTQEQVNSLLQDTNLFIVSFGVDQYNNLYMCSFDGKIYRFQSTTGGDFGSDTKSLKKFRLGQNYPNPFNSRTVITYYLPGSAEVILEVYNTVGDLVKILVNEIQSSGQKSEVWNCKDEQNNRVTSGIYLCKLRVDGLEEVRKMIVIK